MPDSLNLKAFSYEIEGDLAGVGAVLLEERPEPTEQIRILPKWNNLTGYDLFDLQVKAGLWP